MRDRDPISEKPAAPGRYWCRYDELEEFHAGMWKRISGEAAQQRSIAKAVKLLRDTRRFDAALNRVITEWPTSCLAEFTSPGNHLAWMGQAACCIELHVPEEMTRRGWWKLSESERLDANDLAKKAILLWRKNFHGSGVTINNSKNSTPGCGAKSPAKQSAHDTWLQLSLF